MKLLVTGGAGFLGYHVACDLAARGVQAVLYDLAPAELDEYPAGTIAELGDIRDRARLDAVLAEHRPDLAVHAAAALPLWKPDDIRTTAVDGTRNVLAACRAAGVLRVVHVSSTAVYGVPDKHPLEETDPVDGVGAYGEAKIGAEQVCAEARAEGLIVPVVRPKTFIGTARLGVFQILYDWVESHCRIPIIGSGQNRYQLLEVTDLVEAIWLLLTGDEGAVNDVFNVGAEQFGRVLDDVGALCDHAGTRSRPQPTPAGLVKPLLRLLELMHLSPLYKWVYGTADTDSWVSTEKLRAAVGWEAKYSNAEALIRSYQWYQEHRHEIAGATGVTHRVAWRQGALGLVKKLMYVKPPRGG